VLLAACLAGASPAAMAEGALHSVAAAPSWVEPVALDTPAAPPPSQATNGVQYLLLDRQIRVGSQERASYQHIATKVLNEHGLENAANIEIGFDPSYQKLTLHSINVRRGAQVIAKLPTAKVQVLQRESGLESLIFDGRRTAHVFLEDVRVGDVVEYAYTVRGSNPVFEGHHFGGYALQYSVPVARLHARLLWPANHPIHWTAHNGAVEPTARETSEGREYLWDLRQVDARPVDSDAPGWFDPYPAVEWSDFKDWPEVVAWALPLYALPPTASPRLQAVIARIASQNITPQQRLLAALRYVQSEVRYLGIEVGPGSHAPNPPDLVLERRYGDCKDKTLLTVALLHGLGIDARPALVHTQSRHAVESQQPSPGVFNHVLVRARIAQREFWIDPTRSPQQGEIDQLVQADYGRALVIDPATRGLVPMAGRQALASVREVHAVIDSHNGLDQPVRYTVTTTARGAAADAMRNSLDSHSREDLQKQYLNYYAGHFGAMEVAEPMLVTDRRQANEISVKESYQLKEFWQNADNKARREATVSVPDLSDYLRQPATLVRNAPLSLPYPIELEHVTQVILPGDWSIEAEDVKTEDPAFLHERHTRWDTGSRTLTLTDTYQSRVDHVEAAEVARYAANLEKARRNISYVLYKSTNATNATTAAAAAPGGQSLHWVPAVVATLALLGSCFLAWRVYQWDPEPPSMPRSTFDSPLPRGIGGWLLLPAIGLPLTVVRRCTELWTHTGSWKTVAWMGVTDPASSAYHPLFGPLLVFEAVGLIGLLVATIQTVVLFFRKRSSLPRVYIGLLLGSLLWRVLDDAIALLIPATAAKMSARDAGELAATGVLTLLWVAYFLRSKRVRATFVERLRRPPAAEPVTPLPEASPASPATPA
jgi:hypothetical protein